MTSLTVFAVRHRAAPHRSRPVQCIFMCAAPRGAALTPPPAAPHGATRIRNETLQRCIQLQTASTQLGHYSDTTNQLLFNRHFRQSVRKYEALRTRNLILVERVAWSDVIITIEVGRLINGTDVETMDGGHRNSKESVSLIIESEVLFKFELSVTISRFGSNSLQSEPETTQIHIISR